MNLNNSVTNIEDKISLKCLYYVGMHKLKKLTMHITIYIGTIKKMKLQKKLAKKN